jgi:hypothetical protein
VHLPYIIGASVHCVEQSYQQCQTCYKVYLLTETGHFLISAHKFKPHIAANWDETKGDSLNNQKVTRSFVVKKGICVSYLEVNKTDEIRFINKYQLLSALRISFFFVL